MKEEIIKKIAGLSAKNIQLWTENGKLCFKAPAGMLNAEDKKYLKENKEAIIEYLQNDVITFEADEENKYKPFGMTEIQQAYVLGRNPAFAWGGTACHIYMELEYDELNPEKVQAVWNKLIKRHPMLRAVMSVDGYQRIIPEAPEFQVRTVDCTGTDSEEKRSIIKNELDHKIYDTEKFPLYTVVVSKGNDKDILHFSIEFVTADWASIWTVLSEFETLYFNPDAVLPEISLTFRDYLIAEKKLRQGSKYYRDKKYWLDRIDTLPPAPELPVLPENKENPVKFERNQFFVPKEKWDNFCESARTFGVTPASAVMTAYGIVIGRWSRNKEFCLNLSILNRLAVHEQVDAVVGDFTASNILQMGYKEKSSFQEIAMQVNRRLFDDLDHRLFTGVDVLREIQRHKGNVLMPYVFTGAIGLISTDKSRLHGIMNHNGISQTPQVFMDCQAMDTENGLNINIDSRVDVFPDGIVKDICSTLEKLLFSLSENKETWTYNPVKVPLPSWQTDLMEKVNQTEKEQRTYLLHEKVTEYLETCPEAFAVADSEACWNCSKLYEKVKCMTSALKNIGIGRNDFVAVSIPKSRWQLVACLGILNAGAAYVPVDMQNAPKRAESIISKVNAKCVITLECMKKDIVCFDNVIVLTADNSGYEPCGSLIGNHAGTLPEDIAYIIFTSGSTGEPKGVAVSHAAAVNTIEAINRMFNICEKDRIFNLSQLNFDLSVYDLFGVIAEGGGVVIPDSEQYKNPAHWLEMINKYNVTLWNSVPALMQLLIIYQSYNENKEIYPLRLAMLSGDWIPLEQPDKLKEILPDIRVISLGGATEGGIWSIYHEYQAECCKKSEWKSIPYGKPLPNQHFMILDSMGLPCPVWVQGELYITGKSLASCYWGEKELTKNAFVEINGVRAYRTGDTGCYHPDGAIEFLGRLDNQVKIDGHRIELGEIESVIRKQLPVIDVICTVQEFNGEKKLVAVINGTEEITKEILRSELKQWVPNYMIPSICIMTDNIPLNANGKTDYKALSVMIKKAYCQSNDNKKSEKMTPTEKKISEIMCEILGCEKLGTEEDFYEAGANSLILARAAGQINKKIDSSIPFDIFLSTMLNQPNIRTLAELIENKQDKTSDIDNKTDKKPELIWNRCGTEVITVVFAKELSETVMSLCKSDKTRTYVFVPEGYDISELVNELMKEDTERLRLIASDVSAGDCLKTASAIMEQGIVPEFTALIETETESEISVDVPYLNDIFFGLTVSSMEIQDEITEILEEYCMGTINICDCSTEEKLTAFIMQ